MQVLRKVTEYTPGDRTSQTNPLVSVCIPTFNSSRWIEECLESALAQTYQPLEILIVDDASTDDTVELVRSIRDERVRLVSNEANLGLTRNWNKCVEMSQGDFVKFLLHDDVLYPDCVEKMMQLFIAHNSLGLVFSPRDIILEIEPENPTAKTWLRNHGTLHTRFDSLAKINYGRELFGKYLSGGFKGNWIGEPSSVLIKKECFSRLGLFNTKLYQVCDIEMWLRIIFFYDAGFVPQKLSAFRFHRDSTSHANIKSQRHRLDHVRLLEGLLAHDEIRSTYPELEKMRRWERLRNIVRRIIPLEVRLKLFHYFRGA
jgi:glycosyltransferase involved in cell wall biosynthesis